LDVFFIWDFQKSIDDLIKKHLVTLFGLVISTLRSFLVVRLLELKSGLIKFEGASGEIIM